MSSLLKTLKDELQFFIKLLIPTIIDLRNRIENQVANVKVEQGEAFVNKETKLQKSTLNFNSKSKTRTRGGGTNREI